MSVQSEFIRDAHQKELDQLSERIDIERDAMKVTMQNKARALADEYYQLVKEADPGNNGEYAAVIVLFAQMRRRMRNL